MRSRTVASASRSSTANCSPRDRHRVDAAARRRARPRRSATTAASLTPTRRARSRGHPRPLQLPGRAAPPRTSSGSGGDDRLHAGTEPVDGGPERQRRRRDAPASATPVRPGAGRRGTCRPAPRPGPRGRARRSPPTWLPASNTSTATTWARASVGSAAPVSSCRRDRKLMPARLTTALAVTVATISRRSGCDAIAGS